MIIFYNPVDGQVMAVYTDDTSSTVWTNQGFLRARSDILVTRDHQVVVAGGVVTSATPNTNPVPPPLPPTNDEIYDQVIQNQKVFKGYVLAVNDGSIVPGSNMTGAQLKAAVKAKM